MILNNKILFRKKGGASTQYLFDKYGVPECGISVTRQLWSEFTDEVILIQRSDNVGDYDGFGFVNGLLDTASASSFVGSNDGKFKKVINQNKSGKDFEQNTWANMPYLYKSGVLQTDGGLPCMKFEGSQYMSAGNNFGVNYPTYNGYLSTSVLRIQGELQTAFAKSIWLFNTGNLVYLDGSGGAHVMVVNYTNTLNMMRTSDRYLLNFKNFFDGVSKSFLYKNGTQVSSIIESSGIVSNPYRYILGAANNSDDSGVLFPMIGTFQEHLIHIKESPELLPSEGDINTDINTFYTIYP